LLVEPAIPERPEVEMRYKIEERKEWFALDRESLTSVRDYVYRLEAALGFTRDRIRDSNEKQMSR
jgi:hypothetical protein